GPGLGHRLPVGHAAADRQRRPGQPDQRPAHAERVAARRGCGDRDGGAGARPRGRQLDRAGEPVAGERSAREHGPAAPGAGPRPERDAIEGSKGSAARTRYGTEAAAGVLQTFTQHGGTGAPRWSFETGQGIAQLRPFGTDSVPYLNPRPAGSPTGLCHENPAAGCSWIRNAYRQRYTGSVGGGISGSRGFQYFLSGTREDNDGVLPLDNEKKFSTRGNFSVNLFDNVRLDWNTTYANTDLSNTPSGNNA